MKRKDAINLAKFAGYHGDETSYTRIWIEARVRKEILSNAYMQGVAAKKNGVACGCVACNEGSN